MLRQLSHHPYVEMLTEAYGAVPASDQIQINFTNLINLFNNPISEANIDSVRGDVATLRTFLITGIKRLEGLGRFNNPNTIKLYRALYLLAHFFPVDMPYSLNGNPQGGLFVTAHGKHYKLSDLLDTTNELPNYHRAFPGRAHEPNNTLNDEIRNNFLQSDIERLKIIWRKQYGIRVVVEPFFLAGMTPGLFVTLALMCIISAGPLVLAQAIILAAMYSLGLAVILYNSHAQSRFSASLFDEQWLMSVAMVATFSMATLGVVMLASSPASFLLLLVGIAHIAVTIISGGLLSGMVAALLSIPLRPLVNYLASPALPINKQEERFFNSLKPLTSQIGKNLLEEKNPQSNSSVSTRVSTGLKNFSLFSCCSRDSATPELRRALTRTPHGPGRPWP